MKGNSLSTSNTANGKTSNGYGAVTKSNLNDADTHTYRSGVSGRKKVIGTSTFSERSRSNL